MKRSLIASIVLAAGLTITPVTVATASAQVKPVPVKPAPKAKTTTGRPKAVRMAAPPASVRNITPSNQQANSATRSARSASGASVGAPSTSPRGRGSAPQAQGRGGQGAPVPAAPATNRNPKQVTKTGADGKQMNAKSAKKAAPTVKPRRGSDASVQLTRLRRNTLGQLGPQSQSLPNAAAAQGAAYRAIGNVPAVAAPLNRTSSQTYLQGDRRSIKSAKTTERTEQRTE